MFRTAYIHVASVCEVFFSFDVATKMPKWLQLWALSSAKKSHFLNKPTVTKIASPSSLQPVCPTCILFSINLQQLKEEEVLLAFVEEQRGASQVGVRCVSQEVVHFASLELCINNICTHANNQFQQGYITSQAILRLMNEFY